MFEDLRDLYQDIILDHSRAPRHMRRLEVFDAAAKGDNPMCGDRVEIRLRYDAEGAVAEIGFEARGCAISIASADLMAEIAEGQRPEELREMASHFRELARTGEFADARLDALRPLAGVHEYPSRVKCATLPWHALLAALDGGKEASSE
jgi:nitrogen fixation protein NifU and related proteins